MSNLLGELKLLLFLPEITHEFFYLRIFPTLFSFFFLIRECDALKNLLLSFFALMEKKLTSIFAINAAKLVNSQVLHIIFTLVGASQSKIFISLFLPIKILARHRMESKLYEYYLCNLMAI